MRAYLEQLVSPGLGTCSHCHRPWRVPAKRRTGRRTWQQIDRDRFWGHVGVTHHMTKWCETRSCFTLCEDCWAQLGRAQREPHYHALVDEWIRQTPSRRDEYEADRALILEAVRAGL